MKKRMNRRDFLRLSAVAATGAIIAACAPAAPQIVEVVKEVPVEKEVVKTVVVEKEVKEVVTATPKPVRKAKIQVLGGDWEETVSKAFMALHPEITVEVVLAAVAAGQEEKLTTMMAAGTPPDLFGTAEVTISEHIQRRTVLNLQPLIDAEGFDLSAYFPKILDTGRGPEGDLYGFGPDFGAQLLYYNKTLFDEVGLPYPDENTVWDDVKKAARLMTKGEGAEKQYGTMPQNWWAVQFPLVWQNGGDIFSADGQTCLMDSPEAVGALDYMVSFVREGWAPTPQQLSGMGLASGQLFAARRAGMIPSGHWEFGSFKDVRDFEWDVTVLPKEKEPATFLHQAILCISAVTKSPEASWEYHKFACSPEWSAKFVYEVGGQSSLISVAERLATNPPAVAGPGVAKVWKALYGAAIGGRAPYNVLGFLETMDSVWGPAVDKLWSEEISAEEAGQEIKKGADRILQQQG